MVEKKLDAAQIEVLKSRCLHIVNFHGQVPFFVRLVKKGDRYGLRGCLVHDDERPLVEFYDARYPSDESPLGYFVSRYFLETLLTFQARGSEIDLNLDTGSPNWVIDSANLKRAIAWATIQ